MPKETFHQPPNPNGEASPFAEVQWGRGTFVCLMAMAGGDYTNDSPETSRPGFAVDLDRYTINRLIRTLRKARDQAFGADA